MNDLEATAVSADNASAPRTEPATTGEAREDGMDFVMDVPVDLTVEIGRRVMRIGEILRLRTGSVLELTKPAGEPLELYVNNHPIARGEPVVVGDRYGVRVTDVFVDDALRRNGGSR